MAPPDSSTGDQLATCVWVEPGIGLQHSLRVEVYASVDLGRVRAEDQDARPITLPGADPGVVEVSTEFKEVAIWAIKRERGAVHQLRPDDLGNEAAHVPQVTTGSPQRSWPRCRRRLLASAG